MRSISQQHGGLSCLANVGTSEKQNCNDDKGTINDAETSGKSVVSDITDYCQCIAVSLKIWIFENIKYLVKYEWIY